MINKLFSSFTTKNIAISICAFTISILWASCNSLNEEIDTSSLAGMYSGNCIIGNIPGEASINLTENKAMVHYSVVVPTTMEEQILGIGTTESATETGTLTNLQWATGTGINKYLQGDWKNDDPSSGSGRIYISLSESNANTIDISINGNDSWKYSASKTFPEDEFGQILTLFGTTKIQFQNNLSAARLAADTLGSQFRMDTDGKSEEYEINSTPYSSSIDTEVGINEHKAEKLVKHSSDNIPSETEINDVVDIDQEKIYTVVEEMPYFQGGEEKLFDYLRKNIIYPPAAREKGIHGKVSVTFLVDRAGKVRDAKILRGISSDCDEEALRVVLQMPDWKPGKMNGKNVNVQYNLPINFTLK